METPEELDRLSRRTLLTFVGYHDPYYNGTLEGEDLKSPILYLLELEEFDRVLLFAIPNLVDRTKETASLIQETSKSTAVRIVYYDRINDPTDYGQIFAELRKQIRRIYAGDTAYYISATASGTPQMHVVWLMMAASGEIPAKILQARPPHFVTAQRQAVDEVGTLATGYLRIQSLKTAYEQEELRRTSVQCVMEEKSLSFARRN